jgi:hypothetical protein
MEKYQIKLHKVKFLEPIHQLAIHNILFSLEFQVPYFLK